MLTGWVGGRRPSLTYTSKQHTVHVYMRKNCMIQRGVHRRAVEKHLFLHERERRHEVDLGGAEGADLFPEIRTHPSL